MSTENENDAINDTPPIFKTWKQMYIFVLVLHAVIITLFYLLTKTYS